MKFLVASWKANKTLAGVEEWLNQVRQAEVRLSGEVQAVLCPSFLHLTVIKNKLQSQPLSFFLHLGAQDVSPYPEGTYTGAIAASMLSELAEYVIVGHSERRKYFHETDQEISMKATQALEADLRPILAFSQKEQIETILAKSKEKEKILLMYEPPEAISKQVGPIGVGQAADLGQVLSMAKEVKYIFAKNKFLYGGSVKSNNLGDFILQPEIDGVVVGSASQNAQEFIKMLQLVGQRA